MQTKAGVIPPSRCALVTLINEFPEPTHLRPSSSSWMHVTWTNTFATTGIFTRVNRAWRHPQCSCKTFLPKAVVLRMLGWHHLAMLLTEPSHKTSVWPWCCSTKQAVQLLLAPCAAAYCAWPWKASAPLFSEGFLASKVSSSHWAEQRQNIPAGDKAGKEIGVTQASGPCFAAREIEAEKYQWG